MEKIAGHLEIGTNGQGEIVVNHPELQADVDGVGHLVFSPEQARVLAETLRRKANDADVEISKRQPESEPKKVRHIVGRIRHEATARALYAYMRERFHVMFEYEYNEGEKWWLMMAIEYGDDDSDRNIIRRESSSMCEACRAFIAGRQSMVD